MQFLGMALVVSSTTLIGVYFGNIYSFRIRDLKEIRKALVILKSEIEYSLMPIGQAASNISEKLRHPISSIFLKFSNLLEKKVEPRLALQQSFEKYKFDTYLTEEDTSQFNSLGKTLGYLDKNLQLNSIEITIKYLEEKINELTALHIKNKKLYQTLGILAGVLIVVIMF